MHHLQSKSGQLDDRERGARVMSDPEILGLER
jgi:hypothetical protein